MLSGSTFAAASGANIDLYGANTTMEDNKAPVFATPQTRDIAQPLIVIPQNANVVASNANFIMGTGSFRDGGSSGGSQIFFVLPLTKIINGATLTEVSIFVTNFSGGTITSANATFSAWKCAANSGVPSQLGGTQTLGSIANTASAFLNVTGLTEVVNDALYTYYGQVTCSFGSGAGHLLWSVATTVFSNVTAVGQI
jgi:hypothetical protein